MAARNLFLNTPLTFPVSLFGWQLWSMLGASTGAWESLQCSQTRFGGMELGRGSILKMESQFCPWQNSDTILTHQVVNSCVAFIYLFFISTIRDKILTKSWQNSDMPFWTVLTGPLLENSQCQVLPEIKGWFPRIVDEECMEGLSEEERADFLQAKEQQESCIKRFLGFEETLLTPKLKQIWIATWRWIQGIDHALWVMSGKGLE